MNGMFRACESLKEIGLPTSFGTQSAEDVSLMFYECSSLETLELPDEFDVTHVKHYSCMFSECQSLRVIRLGTSCANALRNTRGQGLGSDVRLIERPWTA